MACYHPLVGYRSRLVNPTGKRSIVFNQNEGFKDMPITLPCGRCIGCRLEKSRVWALRCVHEASLYKDNAFITLTYSEENIPKDHSLQTSDFQKFMKRLRRAQEPKEIRFFHCGEYGTKNGRPHYHACLFNHDFIDKKLWKTVNNQPYYVSQELSELWPQGHSTIGNVTFESAAYVARYIIKKLNGPMAHLYYEFTNEETGEIHNIRKEYVTMSRRPGIGKNWYEKYKKDAFPHDFIVERGIKMKPPKYYLTLLEKEHEIEARKISLIRQQNGQKNAHNNTWDRLEVREILQLERAALLQRNYEK